MADTKRYAKRGWNRLHTATKVTVVVALLAGILIGAVTCIFLSRNDRFLLKGESAYSIALTADGSAYAYVEEGVEAYCFGLDVSDRLTVVTELQQDAEGRYIIPCDKEGTYTITYTVDCIKFGEMAPNGAIKRIRTFTVEGTKEDEHNG